MLNENLNDKEKFLRAVYHSVNLITRISSLKEVSLALLDEHVNIVDGRILNSANQIHVDKCFSLPVSRQELALALSFNWASNFQPRIAAYVAVMATGGVEWNTISILKSIELSSVIVSRIRPSEIMGDLNRTALLEGIPIYCHFGCDGESKSELASSLQIIAPQFLWICNWSTLDENEKLDIYSLSSIMRIVDQRAYDVKEGWIQTIDKQMARAIHSFVATNGLIAEEIAKRIGPTNTAKIAVIRPVLRVEMKFAHRPPSTSSFFQFSRLSNQKRIDRGIRMFQYLQRFGYQDEWNICGDGPLRNELQNLAIGLEGIKFLGFVNTSVTLGNAFGVVQSSDYEGLPMSVIEALAYGVPVFATKTGDLPWLSHEIEDLNCELLTVADMADEERLMIEFLEWRRRLPSLWSSPQRILVAERVKKIFNPIEAGSRYLLSFSDNRERK
jgi:glycosyltransferase involved in cell wall biosynthesis